MRLGVVLTGVGAHAAAGAGVLRALEERGIEPHCVCGMDGGAFAAALYAMGKDAAEIRDINGSSRKRIDQADGRRACAFCGQKAGAVRWEAD